MNIKNYKTIVLFVIAGIFSKSLLAMPDTTVTSPINTTIMLPLYLDSLFKYGDYKYGNTIPKFALSALEFYNGVQMAADSLREEGILAKIEVVDSRKAGATQKLFANYNLNKPQLVIGVLQSANELKTLSGMAFQHNTPFISATYPNDGGVTSNPKLMIVNSTLKTHCAALYKYLQKNNAGQNLLLFTRQGNVDDRIKNYLIDAEKNIEGTKLKWRIVALSDTFSAKQLAYYLDSTKQNAAIGASLDDDFSLRLIRNMSALRPSYRGSVYGMPTWDELNLTKSEFKGVDVYFSTAFVSYSANARIYGSLTKKFKKIANSRPSDMVFKGFEITYRYVKTMAKYPDTFMQHLNDADCKVFADFDFETVSFQNDSDNPDYWENKKLYFIKKTDGAVKGVY